MLAMICFTQNDEKFTILQCILVTESTPDAVARITDDITVNVRKLFQGTPVYTGSVKQDTVR
jgi:hypothetical protein